MKTTDLQSYLQKPLEERQAHLNLSSPCDLPKKTHGSCKRWARDKISNLLGVSFETQNEVKACICHRCDHNSSNGWCLNPLHFYIGTFSENSRDAHEDNPEYVEKKKEQFRKIQPKAVEAALLPEARAKKQQTFKNNKHAQREKNSQWGTMWITDGVTSKKIQRGSSIPSGFRPGRKMPD